MMEGKTTEEQEQVIKNVCSSMGKSFDEAFKVYNDILNNTKITK